MQPLGKKIHDALQQSRAVLTSNFVKKAKK